MKEEEEEEKDEQDEDRPEEDKDENKIEPKEGWENETARQQYRP